MNFGRRVFVAAGALALCGCAANHFDHTRTHVRNASIKGSRLFVYSFLDIRDAEFGPAMLREFDRQFVNELARAGVAAQVLRFRNSEIGKYFTMNQEGVRVPVPETVAKHQPDERFLGANYRLIIFPSKMIQQGGWKFYDVRWEIIDTTTGKTIWSATSKGKHLSVPKNDDDPEGRAKNMVQGALAEMYKSGLLQERREVVGKSI